MIGAWLLDSTDFDLDLFWDELPVSDMYNFTLGQLAATGSGVDHLMVVPTVPVPAAVWLLGSALGLLGWQARRKTR